MGAGGAELGNSLLVGSFVRLKAGADGAPLVPVSVICGAAGALDDSRGTSVVGLASGAVLEANGTSCSGLTLVKLGVVSGAAVVVVVVVVAVAVVVSAATGVVVVVSDGPGVCVLLNAVSWAGSDLLVPSDAVVGVSATCGG